MERGVGVGDVGEDWSSVIGDIQGEVVTAAASSVVGGQPPAATLATATATGANKGRKRQGQGVTMLREQDQYMPVANIIRIMRRILPPNAKISDDAKETIQECVSEYISFVTGEANERCQREQRKTVTADDLLWAMGKLGFDNYVDPLSLFLTRYRQSEGDRASYRGHPLLHNKPTAAPQDFATMMMMQQQQQQQQLQQQQQQLLQQQQQQLQQQQQQQPNINSYMQDGAFQVMQGDHNNNNNNQGILYDDAAAAVLNGYYGAVDPFGGSSSSSGAGGTDGTCQKNGLPNFDIYSQFK